MMELTQKEMKTIHDFLGNVDTDEMFNEYLDDTSDIIRIGRLTYYPSEALKKIDPIAYDCCYSDWLDENLDDETLVQVGNYYYLYDEVIDLLENVDKPEGDDE